MSELRRLTLAEIGKMGDSEIIPSFQARIEKVDQTRVGEGKYGPWSAQNLFVNDGTAKMKVVVWNHDDFKEADIGEERLFESHNGDKGISGIKVKIESYVAKKGPRTGQTITSKVIDIGKQAEISRIGTVPPQEESSGDDNPELAPAPKSPVSQIRAKLGQHANSLTLCFDAAFYVAEVVHKKHPLKPELTIEDIRSIAIHLNISMEKQFIISTLPTGAIDKPAKEPAEDMRALWLKLATPAAETAIAFAVHRGWLIEPGDKLEQWPEKHLPITKQGAVALLAEIQQWAEDGHAEVDEEVPF